MFCTALVIEISILVNIDLLAIISATVEIFTLTALASFLLQFLFACRLVPCCTYKIVNKNELSYTY